MSTHRFAAALGAAVLSVALVAPALSFRGDLPPGPPPPPPAPECRDRCDPAPVTLPPPPTEPTLDPACPRNRC